MTNAKPTPLYETHIKCGGRIVEFGGWLLPVQYSGILAEHRAVREKAGLFDVSHMGEVWVSGPDAQAFLQKLVTNDVASLADNQVQYTTMCYQTGGTVDDLLIYRYSQEKFLLVINAANIAKDFEWLMENRGDFAIELTNASDQIAELALQGPLAEKILSQLTAVDLHTIKYYWFKSEVVVAGKTTMVSRTGYTGEDGFEIYCKPEDVVHLWQVIMETGKPSGLLPAGLGCRDTLRFEAGLPLYGHELSANISPIEAGLLRFVKFGKGDFNGKTVLAEQHAQGPERKIAAFAIRGRGIARADYPVTHNGKRVGYVTTGYHSPTLDKSIGLALITAGLAQTGQLLAVEIRGSNIPIEIIPKSFYKREGK